MGLNKITEYIISIDGEFHSAHATLAEARKIYRSFINLYEIEGKDNKVEILKKQISTKIIDCFSLQNKVVYTGKDLDEAVNF